MLRKSSRLLTLVVVVSIVWFTIAFLLFNGMILSMNSNKLEKTQSLISVPGEMGKPVVLPVDISAHAKTMMDAGWKKSSLNQYVSDMISVHRSLPDFRDEWCKLPGHFLDTLPKTSVIICFHNEAWSVLLRTVHSVLDRSPRHLLEEVILVDDFSDMDQLEEQLVDYFANEPKVKIIRTNKRQGHTKAKFIGAAHARSEILTYLDSRCECTTGWLEPLVDRIARNSATVVCPLIDNIDKTTLEYQFSNDTIFGDFAWDLTFAWHALHEREKKRHKNAAEPFFSPIMSGRIFSIHKKFLEKLGSFDDSYDIESGENLELSFKTWVCGGTLEIVPCSHVGHIRTKLEHNNVRVAQIWLNEYAKFYNYKINNSKVDYGDVIFKKYQQLGCKSFKWYLGTIYSERSIPVDAIASGEIRNVGNGSDTCLDSAALPSDIYKPVGLYSCHHQGGNQFWTFRKHGDIRRNDMCLDYNGQDDVILFPCHGQKGNQLWSYYPSSKLLRHDASEKCLAINEAKNKLLMESCDSEATRQRWSLENYDPNK